MTAVANAAGVFHSFGYSFDDPNGHIQELSQDTIEHLDAMPPFITDWQAQDIANKDFDGYYQNPMQSITMLIYQNANAISELANTGNGVLNLVTVRNSATQLRSNAQEFLSHTSRLSGLTPYVGTDNINPYLDMAMSFGRTAMYITQQTDGITNNAPIMGSFTSLMIEPQLIANNNTLLTYKNQVEGSINMSFDIVLQQNVHTSNLTTQQITNINTHITNLNDYMQTRRIADIDFYSNVKYFIEGYNKTKKLNNMGETEKYLIMNLIGTEKAKTRIS
jgi:hypothetical protein